MIRVQGQEAHPWALTIRQALKTLTDTETVESPAMRPTACMDHFPPQATVLIHLTPAHPYQFP